MSTRIEPIAAYDLTLALLCEFSYCKYLVILFRILYESYKLRVTKVSTNIVEPLIYKY